MFFRYLIGQTEKTGFPQPLWKSLWKNIKANAANIAQAII
jgi:hypothetical protein